MAACRSVRSAAVADVMETLSPLGPVFHAGTLSGNPLATAAGLAALDLLTATCTSSSWRAPATSPR